VPPTGSRALRSWRDTMRRWIEGSDKRTGCIALCGTDFWRSLLAWWNLVFGIVRFCKGLCRPAGLPEEWCRRRDEDVGIAEKHLAASRPAGRIDLVQRKLDESDIGHFSFYTRNFD